MIAAPQRRRLHMPNADSRLELLEHWLKDELRWNYQRIAPASADASFRRYFRIWRDEGTFIVMDAPPDKEDLPAYLRVTKLLHDCDVHVPLVHESDTGRGLALLEDLGSMPYLSRLTAGADADALYGDALRALAAIQLRGREGAASLPPYDREVLLREMQLLPDWFCDRHLQQPLDTAGRAVFDATGELLIADALSQPQVLVHRDYHSRNLMVTRARSPGIIDFQDALNGPVGYDLVSILKDCYIAWPRARVTAWVREYRQLLLAGGADAGTDDAQFLRWFDFIGLQRHIKVLGIFARLFWRDGKPAYLGDLPRTLDYVRDTAARYPELADFALLVERSFAPQLAQANQRALCA
ncbi:MAG: phosphotransferase [Steroidobacteraceae bacterium]